MKTQTIIRLAHGWYNFEDVPQGYIKVANLRCGTDKQAMKQAKKLNPDCQYTIKDKLKQEAV